jgi:hypothetical protein
MFDSIGAKTMAKDMKGCNLQDKFSEEKSASSFRLDFAFLEIQVIGDVKPNQSIEFKHSHTTSTETSSVIVNDKVIFSAVWDKDGKAPISETCSNLHFPEPERKWQ